MNPDDIKKKLMEELNYIGNALVGAIQERIQQDKIVAFGDFRDGIESDVKDEGDELVLKIWGSAKHTEYVLGGTFPTWKYMPLAPLEAWVEKKRLSWVDQKGDRMSSTQMAAMIRNKIRRDGIPGRNVFRSVLKEKMNWIWKRLDTISERM